MTEFQTVGSESMPWRIHGERPDAPRPATGSTSLRRAAYPDTSKVANARSAAAWVPRKRGEAIGSSQQRSARFARTHATSPPGERPGSTVKLTN